jgi:hypothetical protein
MHNAKQKYSRKYGILRGKITFYQRFFAPFTAEVQINHTMSKNT